MTNVERRSGRELVISRVFDAPRRRLFAAWTTPELLRQWWAPPSCGVTFVACEADARPGGIYRFVFRHPAAEEPMTFHGRYLEVIPEERLVWTNEESEGVAVTTVTFGEEGGKTRLVMHEFHPSTEALDAAMASGGASGAEAQFAELDALLSGSR